MKLHLGCGQIYLEDYVNIDYPLDEHSVQEKSVADEFADLTALRYKPETIEEVRLHHVFEHFPRTQAVALLASWHSWLEKGGQVRIEVPDFNETAKLVLGRFTKDHDRKVAIRHIFGSNEAAWAVHYDAWSEVRFRELFDLLGFELTEVNRNSYLATRNIEVIGKKNRKSASKESVRKTAKKYLSQFKVNDSPDEKCFAGSLDGRLRPPAGEDFHGQMKHSSKSVSVIMPTYNRASFLPQAVESVNSQTQHSVLEIVIVDDGSTDETDEIVKNLAGPIRYFKLKHTGSPAKARNYGIKKARGDLIAFLDSDDAWRPDKLERQISVFENPDVMLSFGQAAIIDGAGKNSGKKVTAPAKLKNGEKFLKLLNENVIPALTVMLRKSALDKVGLFNEKLKFYEDYELWLRLSAAYPKGLKAVDGILADYRVHSGNVSSAGTAEALEKLLEVYNELWSLPDLTPAQRLGLEDTIFNMQENWSRQQNTDNNIPTISVVMSMYNSERYLREAVDSILGQQFTDFEFIIINDGSSDKSVDIINSYDDPRIRLVHQTNHGLVYSFNKGIKLARATYIARMDSDDISLPSRFTKELEWLEKKPKRGLVGSYFAYVDKNSKRTAVTMTWPTKHIDILRTMYFVNPYGHGTIMMRREAAIGVGAYRAEYEPAEDYDLWTRIAERWEIGEIPEVLYLWRLHYKNVSHTESEIQNKSAAKIVSNLWKRKPANKSFFRIILDARYYKKLRSEYSSQVAGDYMNNQSKLAAEFLSHGKLLIGYKTALAALFLNPGLTLSYWETFLRAPIRKIRGR